jgi:hypothetical protein
MNTLMNTLNESSIQRVLTLLNKNTTVAVISAFIEKPELLAKAEGLPTIPSKEEQKKINLARHERLKKELQGSIGFIEMDSGYIYQGDTSVSPEKSFFIPGIDKASAFDIAKRWNQESILWKDDSGFFLLSCKDGSEWMTFSTTGLDLSEEVVKKAFSALIRANKSQKGVKFSYVQQKEEPTVRESLVALDMGRIPRIKTKRIKL